MHRPAGTQPRGAFSWECRNNGKGLQRRCQSPNLVKELDGTAIVSGGVKFPNVAVENVPPCEIEPVPFPLEEGGAGMLSKESVIVLRHYEGLSETAIAEKLGINRRSTPLFMQRERGAEARLGS